ncbi:regulatory protein RecX [Pontibacter sp. G13]|uniref:regulatory protein RecX n=1 Tax=Pontibacter sp. G13 TaxID=3074898 RepID=UPI00288AD456|nr:regulatory protein RecX [Pontibacter sp. G13]WNJ21491.1 regulatory protein RecX [Pontibacter sp. G13]
MAEEILTKIYKYCVYQDRCKSEVVKKLKQLGIEDQRVEPIIEHLEAERYLDEQRYATSFARGKFTYKHWGRIKIQHELQSKGIPDDIISEALAEEVDDEVYEVKIRKLLQQKIKQIKDLPDAETRVKLSRYMVQKGYEYDFVNAGIDRLFESVSESSN